MSHLRWYLLFALGLGLSCSAAEDASVSDAFAPVQDARVQIPAGVQPLFDTWIRDTYVTRGDDGYFYLTGTTALPGRTTAGDINDGIRLWRSPDLKTWYALGLIWSLDRDATWQKKIVTVRPGEESPSGEKLGDERRSVWAPEIHYIRSKHQWLIVACLSGDRGSFVLRSTSGRPEGPYENIAANATGPIFGEIDPSLFEDDDGTVYFVGHNHYIARMKDDLSGLAEPMRRLAETPYDPEPYGEAVSIVKFAGKYHLVQAYWSFQKPDRRYSYFGPQYNTPSRFSYDTVAASADNIYGPYGPRYTVAVGGGGGNFFQDAQGQWWSSMFGNPRGAWAATAPFLCRPAVFPLQFKDGHFAPAPLR